MIKNKMRKGVSLIIFVFSAIVLLAFVGFAIDVGYVLNTQSELQKALETSALKAASNYEPINTAGNVGVNPVDGGTTLVEATATNTFNAIISNNSLIANATITNLSLNDSSKALVIESNLTITPFFMGLVGVRNINIDGKAAALNTPFYLSKFFPRGLSNGSVIRSFSGDTNLRDAVADNDNVNLDLDALYDMPDGESVSLGSFGYLTIRLPMPAFNGPGYDLLIKETGNLDGYFVFAGNDIDPDAPYFNEINPGGGIAWKNISDSGYPLGVDPTSRVGAYKATVEFNGNNTEQAKIYGSALFDLDTAGLSSAKYLKIVDDGRPDGFIREFANTPVIFVGEHSSVTPGADIDGVAVLHHAKLISSTDFLNDSDSDNLIDILEEMIGTKTNDSDSDNDGLNDDQEYIGYGSGGTIISTSAAAGEVNMSSPLTEASDDDSEKILIP